MTMDHYDHEGVRFFDTGKDITTNLGWLAKALQSRDAAAIERFYPADFSGTRLGLNSLAPADAKDGVRRYAFRSDGATTGRDAALAEWRAYLDGFASIEAAELHIHRLEKWEGQCASSRL